MNGYQTYRTHERGEIRRAWEGDWRGGLRKGGKGGGGGGEEEEERRRGSGKVWRRLLSGKFFQPLNVLGSHD